MSKFMYDDPSSTRKTEMAIDEVIIIYNFLLDTNWCQNNMSIIFS